MTKARTGRRRRRRKKEVGSLSAGTALYFVCQFGRYIFRAGDGL